MPAPLPEAPVPLPGTVVSLDLPPNDPLVAYFSSQTGVVELGKLNLDSPALRELREECGLHAEPRCLLNPLEHDYGDRVVRCGNGRFLADHVPGAVYLELPGNDHLYFLGDTLYTTLGVFIENLDANDVNRVVFLDQNGVQRTYPFSSAGTLTFNGVLQGAGSYYRMYFGALPGASDDFGEAGAVTVNDAAGNPIAGAISGGSVSFTFDYDGNTQGGRTAGADAAVVVVAGRPGSAKPVVATGTLTRSKGISIALVAEQDRGYVNP